MSVILCGKYDYFSLRNKGCMHSNVNVLLAIKKMENRKCDSFYYTKLKCTYKNKVEICIYNVTKR